MDTSNGLQPEKGLDLDLPELKAEILVKIHQCQQRGLTHSFKWLSEILYSLRKHGSPNQSQIQPCVKQDQEIYFMAKSYFDLKEYDRCAFFTQQGQSSPQVKFLHFYSRYLAGEKRRLDAQTDIIISNNLSNLEYLKELRSDLQKMSIDEEEDMDGFMLYLYGVVLKKLNLKGEAQAALVKSIWKEPCLWSAWQELAFFVQDRSLLAKLSLPDHWCKKFFLAHCYLELLLNDSAMDIYFDLQKGGLEESTYIMAQVAIAFHNKRELDQAVDSFKQLTNEDPYRLDNLDTYSNVLYVKEQRLELAHLAHHTVQIDKYRPETCCVIGNYYSLRSQHAKAVLYFQRALKLNPNYLSAWTLMGHEFMELKNKSAAIQSYRHAIDVNPRDYRAWYGLGQTYEMLKMHSYCLYYYKKAQELRPNDSRMLMALGDSYEKLEKLPDALKCYWKAHCLGDVERSVALFHLARLYEKTEDNDQAAAAYQHFIADTDGDGFSDDRDQLSKAYRFLANYHKDKGNFDEAYEYAQKCTEFADTREDGKALLKEISLQRGDNEHDRTESLLHQSSDHHRGLHRDVERVLRDNNGSFARSPPNNDSGGSPSATNDLELEPMNLTFTP